MVSRTIGDDLYFPLMDRNNKLGGVTKREEFAKAAMIGLLSHSCDVNPEQKKESEDDVALRAVKMADALIEALGQ